MVMVRVRVRARVRVRVRVSLEFISKIRKNQIRRLTSK